MSFSHSLDRADQATQADAIVTGAFFALCAFAISLVFATSQDTTGQLALIYPPWTSGSEALARASASDMDLVGFGRYPFIVIVAPRSSGPVSHGRRDGAMLTLAANGFGGCLKAAAQVRR